MKKKDQPGGSSEESSSIKPRKSTTKKASKPKTTTKKTTKKEKIIDKYTDLSVEYWEKYSAEVLTDTILSKGPGNIRAANPRYPEDKEWWDKAGPEYIANWMRFREHSAWQIWTTPDGVPAIEIEMHVDVNGVIVKMILDRVMVNDQGELIIVDLKTGKRTPEATLQLGFYRYGLWKKYGILIDKGAYWMARQAVITDPVDLSNYTPEKIEYLVQSFDNARKAGAFIPNTNSCGMCGYTMHCEWYIPKGENK
jgi:hypothetical protein